MKKFNFLLLMFLLTTVSQSLFLKTMFLKCDTLFFKITEPLVGFTKTYII